MVGNLFQSILWLQYLEDFSANYKHSVGFFFCFFFFNKSVEQKSQEVEHGATEIDHKIESTIC